MKFIKISRKIEKDRNEQEKSLFRNSMKHFLIESLRKDECNNKLNNNNVD